MQVQIKRTMYLEGSVELPGDKSISHRALLLNSIAHGMANIENLSAGADCRSTIKCLRALGVSIEPLEGSGQWHIQGAGSSALKEPQNVLNAGNSGTTARLLMGILASQPIFTVLTGDRSLRSRPMDRVVTPLCQMGARIWSRCESTLAPVAVYGGSLNGIEYSLPMASAQTKSALLIAGLFARTKTVLHQIATSRDHTERMMRSMGASISENGLTVSVEPGSLAALDIRVPGDISSAAFWMVAAACHPKANVRLSRVGINPGRSGIIDVLKSMGANIAVSNIREHVGEPVADIEIQSSDLVAIEIGGELIPRVIDELPVLAVAACFARGTTVIRDAGELRMKESDRIRTVVRQLSNLGADIVERPDGMIINGQGHLTGGLVQGFGDHRVAMAMGVAALLADGETIIRGGQASQVSYPNFWTDMKTLGGFNVRIQ